MTGAPARPPGPEPLLARVLSGGTWLASGIIALGLALPLPGWPGDPPASAGQWVVTAGIAILILLPVLRVLLMLIAFVRGGDYRLGAIAALVLAVIALGSVLGLCMAGRLPG